MSIVVRGLSGTNLVVRGLAETFGLLRPISAPFLMTDALLAFLFTTMDPGDRATSATLGAATMALGSAKSSANINNPNTATQTRPLTAVVHRTGTAVLVHGG